MSNSKAETEKLFVPIYISTFMGGDFSLRQITSVKDLKDNLKLWLSELDGWRDDLIVTECVMMHGKMSVTLKDGIVQ